MLDVVVVVVVAAAAVAAVIDRSSAVDMLVILTPRLSTLLDWFKNVAGYGECCSRSQQPKNVSTW